MITTLMIGFQAHIGIFYFYSLLFSFKMKCCYTSFVCLSLSIDYSCLSWVPLLHIPIVQPLSHKPHPPLLVFPPIRQGLTLDLSGATTSTRRKHFEKIPSIYASCHHCACSNLNYNFFANVNSWKVFSE
jgi:hypothetical protein